VRVLYRNRITPDVTITAASMALDLPAKNIAHPHLSRIYRTGKNDANEWISIDLGSAQAVQALILYAHTLTAGDSDIRLQGNSSNVWTGPSFDMEIPYYERKMTLWLPEEQAFQYWRIVFTKSSASESRDIGAVYLGLYDEYEMSPAQPDGVKITPTDLSTTDRVPGGQTYSDKRGIYDRIDLDFPGAIPEEQSAQMLALARTCGIHTPFYVSISPQDKPYAWLYYVKAQSLAAQSVRLKLGRKILWSASMRLEGEI